MPKTDQLPQSASRRALLGAAAAASGLVAAPAPATAGPSASPFSTGEMRRIFERYQGFGDKAAGGEGDNASGAWLIAELEALGYRCTRQAYEAPAYEGAPAELVVGAERADLIPQAIVAPTGPEGLRARLYLAGSPAEPRDAIALVVLPFARWSSVKGEVERRVKGELDRGAAGAVLVTTGPTGDALALNAPADRPLFAKPVAVLAPRDAQPFIEASLRGDEGVLRIPGRTFRRPAFNVTASLDRGAGRALVLSTPRSGWFGCAGERGPGIAVWLAVARWASSAGLKADIELVATSGHEYENAGGEHYIRNLAPSPRDTALWIHLGANVAARDWHERGPTPLPSADAQRYLMASPALLSLARRAFAGQPGLENPYGAKQQTAAGELSNILAAGYDPVLGIFGAHRFHHSRGDDLRCVSPSLAILVADALVKVISRSLGARD